MSPVTCSLPGCTKSLPRDGRHRKFCCEAHRARAARLRARGLELDDHVKPRPTDGEVYAVTTQYLHSHGVADTLLGRAALELAAAIDDPRTAPAALVTCTRELRPTIAAAIELGQPVPDDDDELLLRRLSRGRES